MEEWWCPAPWRVRLDDVELRAGGSCSMPMLGPDGEEMPRDGLFFEMVDGQRIVSTDALVRDNVGHIAPADPFMIGGWKVTPENGGTRYRAWPRHWTEEKQAEHVAMGFAAGWQAVAEQFKSLCEAEAKQQT